MSGTWNGIGTTFIGSKDQYPDESFATTEWFVIFYFPIIPFRSVRIAFMGSSSGWRRTTSKYLIIKSLPLDTQQIFSTYLIALATVLTPIISGVIAGRFVANSDLVFNGTLIGFLVTMMLSSSFYFRPRPKTSPSPSPILVFPAIIGTFLTIISISSSFFAPSVRQITIPSTPIPAVISPTPRPTQKQPTPTLPKITYNGVPCLLWKTITNTYIESHICVYGKVFAPKNSKGWSSIQFSPNADALRVIDFNYIYYTPIQAGDCVAIYGRIRDNGAYLIITPDKDAKDSIRGLTPASRCDD